MLVPAEAVAKRTPYSPAGELTKYELEPDASVIWTLSVKTVPSWVKELLVANSS